MTFRRIRRLAGFIFQLPLLSPAPTLRVRPATPLAVSSARQFGWLGLAIAPLDEQGACHPDAIHRAVGKISGKFVEKLSESHSIFRQHPRWKQRRGKLTPV
jgi:hypothetical protein